jgi:hypothetical protein
LIDESESFIAGLPALYLQPIIKSLRKAEKPYCRTLGVELEEITINFPRDAKVPEGWIERIVKRPSHHQLLSVKRSIYNTNGADILIEEHNLLEGDVILTFNGSLITRLLEYELNLHREFVDATIVRRGMEKKLRLQTIDAETFGVKHVLQFCGMVLHIPILTVRLQCPIHSEVYISSIEPGSPAALSYQNISHSRFIVELDGHPTPTLSTFLNAIKVKTSDSCKLKLWKASSSKS